jgi:hypothetical protein
MQEFGRATRSSMIESPFGVAGKLRVETLAVIAVTLASLVRQLTMALKG